MATTLDDGYTIEEQLTGKAEWAGLQIVVIPLTERAYQRHKAEQIDSIRLACQAQGVYFDLASRFMGMASGGKIKQTVYKDPFPKGAWDIDAVQRVFVSLHDASNWAAVTGEEPPNSPPTPKDYEKAGLPWFTYYGADQPAVGGGSVLAGVASLGTLIRQKTGETLPASGDINTGPPIVLGAAPDGLQGRVGRSS